MLQVRGWATAGEIRDSSALADARKTVEREMVRWAVLVGWGLCGPGVRGGQGGLEWKSSFLVSRQGILPPKYINACPPGRPAAPLPPPPPSGQERFKCLERELKIKQFSSEGLLRDSADPEMVAKVAAADWLSDTVAALETQASQPAPTVVASPAPRCSGRGQGRMTVGREGGTCEGACTWRRPQTLAVWMLLSFIVPACLPPLLAQVEQFEADIEAQQLKGGKGGKPFQ